MIPSTFHGPHPGPKFGRMESGSSHKPGAPDKGNSKTSKHTVLLLQTSKDFQSRTYLHFSSVGEALDGLVLMYEQALAHTDPSYTPAVRKFTEIYEFFDSFVDLGVLVFTPAVNGYRPYTRQWLKEKLFEHLKREHCIHKDGET
ncbi:putative Enhancer of rudimentary-like protein [Monocercomonoides exilis]|uniref:putative Enhancer of rudimentary-like protein n=1 Tax=Monocercomonoides exilis TaxID=2049356 RepID=UPI003559CDD2|nr:putative Enhancer of rudimentary-like protein [Monocercomonoides exilis]|eukprot:MONOS_1819.1-p1 / transcript=MONOS_1819.1 / gene=MONOS_1819 / organism=Monocercomonoides_exilis_PA203 / gene_product=Enhancer of rudimentary-like protein / transcript_product=Enhancer of rudimentary-like protein / location=Mono_scaffold00034:95376-95933(-) / protein_length=143 / sequence_SO=supercontig / SO=protein_coding / is_pseudo=false